MMRLVPLGHCELFVRVWSGESAALDKHKLVYNEVFSPCFLSSVFRWGVRVMIQSYSDFFSI